MPAPRTGAASSLRHRHAAAPFTAHDRSREEMGCAGQFKMRSLRALWFYLFLIVAVVAPTQRSDAWDADLDASVHATLDNFFYQIGGARELANKAFGILVFPSVVKAGFGFGGEYGEGALLIRGRPVDYYNTVSASFGFQLGAQV